MREVNDALYGEEIRLAEHEILSGKNVFFLELRWIHLSAMPLDSVTYFKLGLLFHEVSSLLYNTAPSERIQRYWRVCASFKPDWSLSNDLLWYKFLLVFYFLFNSFRRSLHDGVARVVRRPTDVQRLAFSGEFKWARWWRTAAYERKDHRRCGLHDSVRGGARGELSGHVCYHQVRISVRSAY